MIFCLFIVWCTLFIVSVKYALTLRNFCFALAEFVLHCGVGDPASSQQGDVAGCVVGLTHDLVQRARIGGIQGPHHAVGGHTRGPGGLVDVTRASSQSSGEGESKENIYVVGHHHVIVPGCCVRMLVTIRKMGSCK